MRVAELKIENFRGIRHGVVRFKKHLVLVGSNNAGKTTLIEALALLLGRDRMIRELTEHDFFGSNPQPADRIRLIATITDFPGDDPHISLDWFRDGRGIPKWLDEATGSVHPLQDNHDWKLCCQIGFQAFFDQDSLTVDTIRYFYDHDNPVDPFADDSPVGVPPKLIQQMGFYLIRANRTWDKVFSWGSELFRRTVQTAAAHPSVAILAERDRLRAPDDPIEKDPALLPLISNVNSEIARFFPNAPTIQLRVTNTDSRSVMDAVSAHFAVKGGNSVPASRQGSGLVSLQSLLLLLELGRARAADGEGFIMALEEPELHLHPSSQQQLVQRIQALSTQTIITTHSPAIAASADPTSVLMLRNVNGQLMAEPFLTQPMLSSAQNWERKFFQQSRMDVIAALTHSAILIPEGRSDCQLLQTILRPLMLKQDWVTTMQRVFGLEVGVVPTEDAKVVETYLLLSRIHDRICCLVDGDPAGQQYAQLLLQQQPPPVAVISWRDGCMIEDTIGWILRADEAVAVASVVGLASFAFQTAEDIIVKLKTKKLDIVFYEAIADVIANNIICAARAAEVFNGLALACAGVESQLFKADARGVLVFQP
jgi:putative ATP-dependent endonuclease of the OLD family